MKEVVREIHACIHASGESINDYVREFSKIKDLALETNGTKPIQKAAFALHYLCCYIDDNQSMPALVVEGVLLYCTNSGYTWENNSLERMYKNLRSADTLHKMCYKRQILNKPISVIKSYEKVLLIRLNTI